MEFKFVTFPDTAEAARRLPDFATAGWAVVSFAPYGGVFMFLLRREKR